MSSSAYLYAVKNSSLGYLSLSKLLTLYHYSNLLLSLLPFKDSNPRFPLTASLHVLEEHLN